MKTKSRKIWSLPLVLVTALLLVGLFAVTVLAQTPNVPSTMTAVVEAGEATTIAYEVRNAPTAAADDTGPSAITAVLDTVTGVNAAGTELTGGDIPVVTATFELDDGTDPDNISFSISPAATAAGSTYTVKLIAVYDTDREVAAVDNAATTDVLEDGRADAAADADTIIGNDRDGQLRTTVTIHVPSVPAALNFQVDPDKVVDGEIISRVGNDRANDPLVFEIDNLGPGTITVAADTGAANANVSYEIVGGNKIEVSSAVNNLAAATYNATITVDGGDFDLDEDDETFELEIGAVVGGEASLTFDNNNNSADTLLADFPDDDGIHYTVTIPETTPPGTGVLPYFVNGAATVSTDPAPNDIPAEQVTGVIGGSSANLFRVNNSTMAIEYDGPAGGLTAGVEHTLRLTASGDTGLANRLIVGMVKIIVADVDRPPTGVPETLPTTLDEDEPGDGLVKDNTQVYDFADVGEDPEGRALTYSTDALGFDFDGTKLMVNLPGDTAVSPAVPSGIVDIIRAGDNPATTDVTESDWPSGTPDNWQFATNPPTSEYPDLTRTIDVAASDGVVSNDKIIELTITLDLNEPPVPSTDVVTADDGSMSYSGTAIVGDDDRGVAILAFSDIMTDGDSDSLSVTLSPVPLPADAEAGAEPDPVPPELLVRNNEVQLIFVPSSSPTLTYNFIMTVSDDYNPAVDDSTTDDDETIDLTMEVTVVVTVEQPPAPKSDIVEIVVAENTSVCNVKNDDDTLGDCTLAGQVDDGTVYTILSGVDDGDTDYDIDPSTGLISVVNMPDYEADKNPAFIVEITNNDGDRLGVIAVRVSVTDVNEEPTVAAIDGVPWVYETAQVGAPVQTKPPLNDAPSAADYKTVLMVNDPENGTLSFTIKEAKQAFTISSGVVSVDHDNNATTPDVMGGLLSVSGALNTEEKALHEFTVVVSDGTNPVEVPVSVHIINANETPEFTSPLGDTAVKTIPENTGASVVIFTFTATDEDVDDLTFALRQGQSQDLFEIKNVSSATNTDDVEVWSGDLHVRADGPGLDYENAGYDPRVHVEVNDPAGLNDTLLLVVNLNNVNDNAPEFDVAPATSLSVPENTARGFVLANYSANDADGDIDGDGVVVSYSLSGGDAKSFHISATGDLMTLESLDADRQEPCGADGCVVTIIATDGTHNAPTSATNELPPSVRISVTAIEDSVSTLDVTKANPVPGTEFGNPMSALAGNKTSSDEYLWNMLDCAGMKALVNSTDDATYCKMWDGLSATAKGVVSAALGKSGDESPDDLPATYGSAPMNFVETEWANWGTVLRIAVIAESPDATCGNGNQCVVININSDSADDSLKLEAYRSGDRENRFVAAVTLVEESQDVTPGEIAVYKHTDGGVPALRVDEEDEIEIEFGNLRGSIDVENEAPEISNFAPEHEAAFDDADVDYTFTVTDSLSGLPEPEDLPDIDGDADYTPVVALISRNQCETHDSKTVDDKVLKVVVRIQEDETLYCRGTESEGEYIATEASSDYGFAPIRDDRDFDEIDDGFEVETTIVLDENKTYYVTFIACDNAGNCTFYDPDGNDHLEELAQITVDTEEPEFVEARTGLTWDSTDNEYDENKSFIQVIFDDLTNLNVATVEIDDFVVEGHTIKDVHIFENPDDDDVNWADSGDYGDTDSTNKRRIDRYRDLENAVFLELEDELLADETPDVAIVPNGVEDKAGNEQDDGDKEADDWISPTFTIVSMVSTLETSQSEVLAGDDDEVTVVVTSDERLDSTRPTVTVTYVKAPSGSVKTKGTEVCDDGTGTRERGEIVLNENDPCGGSRAAGGTLNNSVEKVSNTEWIVTITEPKDTGYYNFRIEGSDRSPQENSGSEGVSPDAIVSDFFDADGDVNVDDAIFFEGDINLPKPEVRVSGVRVRDNEADVEFRSPLFVELDFAANHSTCSSNADDDERMANCENENSEYAEDNFDDVVVTSFMLDGVDITDSVKTTDNQSFLVSLESISIGDHTATVQAVDQAGNVFEDTLEIDFEVNDRDPFEKRLSPGWNLVSLPGEPADSSIAAVFGPGVEVRTVYSYDPVIPGGWQVAVRETLDSDWQGDLTEITGQRGYWVLSDAIQDWEVSIPRLAGGAAGTGTPIQPPVIPMYAGWNLIPVTDVSGNALSANIEISAEVYLNSLDDGLDLARVLGFNTIKNEWFTVLDMQIGSPGDLRIGSGYWVFVREAAALVPGGIAGVSGGD